MNYKKFAPYDDEARNTVYNRLFCDNPKLFEAEFRDGEAKVFDPVPKKRALREIIQDSSRDLKMRLLASNVLRKAGGRIRRR